MLLHSKSEVFGGIWRYLEFSIFLWQWVEHTGYPKNPINVKGNIDPSTDLVPVGVAGPTKATSPLRRGLAFLGGEDRCTDGLGQRGSLRGGDFR